MSIIKKSFLEVKAGGLKILVRKLFTFITLILYAPLYLISFIVLIIIYIIKPVYLIRFGNLNSSRLGHFASNTELYLCERDAKINLPKQKYLDLFFLQNISNDQIAKMWKRELTILPSLILNPIYFLNKLISYYFPSVKNHIVTTSKSDRDVHNLLDQFGPHLKFTEEEIAIGEDYLKKFGLSINSKFVCLIVRDNAYLQNTYPEKNWEYHNYRNYDVDNFMPAAEALTERGYYVFRMGSKVEKKLKSANKKIIDYASSKDRCDFLDVFLGAKCNFCISTTCGFDAIPNIFRVPLAYITVPIQLFFTSSKNFLIMTKHHISKKLNRKLKFSEIIQNKIGNINTKDGFEKKNITLVENSPSEIKEFVLEMLDRYENKWSDDEKNRMIQTKFWKNYKNFLKNENLEHLHGDISAKVSINFLKKNTEWLN